MATKLPLVSAAFAAGLLAQPLVAQATPGDSSIHSASRPVSQPISPSLAAREKLKDLSQKIAEKRKPFVEESGPKFLDYGSTCCIGPFPRFGQFSNMQLPRTMQPGSGRPSLETKKQLPSTTQPGPRR